MKISRLMTYLEHIQEVYGDLEIKGNIIAGSEAELSGLCVVDNYALGYESPSSGNRYELLIEVEEYDSGWKPIFNCYEYPSNTNIEVN